IVLMNRGTSRIRGTVRLTGSDGRPLAILLNGSSITEFNYQIEALGVFRAELNSTSGLNVGYATVTPDAGNSTPTGTAIFRFIKNGQLVTEAGVATTARTTRARIFVDNAASRTGVAIANPGNQPANLTFTLMYGSANIESTITRTLDANAHLAIFASELFPSLTDGFTGVMEISSSTSVAAITLKITTNSRNDFVTTTLPVADMTRAPSTSRVIFPQLAIGSGFSTRLVLINTDPAKVSSGRASFYQSDGTAMTIPLSGQTASQFTIQVAAGGGRQLYPGNTAQVSAITIVDISTNTATNELVINEGNTIRPRLRVIDNAGQLRDDFTVSYASSNANVAAVNADGSVKAVHSGFSSFTMSANGVVAAGTITVAHIDS